MSLNLQTTTAIIDENGELHGSEKLLELRSRRVHIVIVSDAKSDVGELTPSEWERGAATLMAPDFADDTAEDIYTENAGRPFDASQY